MLQSTGLQRVVHDLVTEQQEDRQPLEACQYHQRVPGLCQWCLVRGPLSTYSQRVLINSRGRVWPTRGSQRAPTACREAGLQALDGGPAQPGPTGEAACCHLLCWSLALWPRGATPECGLGLLFVDWGCCPSPALTPKGPRGRRRHGPGELPRVPRLCLLFIVS